MHDQHFGNNRAIDDTFNYNVSRNMIQQICFGINFHHENQYESVINNKKKQKINFCQCQHSINGWSGF